MRSHGGQRSHVTILNTRSREDRAQTFVPPGRGKNPSRLTHRHRIALLALGGAVVAAYLTLYQLGAIRSVWEPFFGNGSQKILDSSLARSLPVPDAALGVLAYLVEIVLDLVGGEDRWQRRPGITLAFGAVVLGMALGSIGLVLMQVFYFRAFCTLCLVSAAISLMIAFFALGEPIASLRLLRGPDLHP